MPVKLTYLSILLMFAALVLSAVSAVNITGNVVIERTQSNAALIASIVHKSTKLYSDEAVDRIRDHDEIQVSNRFRDFTHGIPNPATFTIMLAESLTNEPLNNGLIVRMYSDLPFLNRTGRTLDSFAKRALGEVRSKPVEPYQSIEMIGETEVLRYANPMIMESSCVACHATHPDSPKTDWNVGDVRGVLEISQPLMEDGESFRTIYVTRILLVTAGIFIVMAVVLIFLRNYLEKQFHRKEVERRTRRLRHESLTDELTGIGNRRFFRQQLDLVWEQCHENRSALTIAIVDVDHFKQFNDRLGHMAGDQCLRLAGQCIEEKVSSFGATVARFGGEEFALIIPNLSIDETDLLLESLRLAIESISIKVPGELGRKSVTASIGVVSVSSVLKVSKTELIHTADQAMYRAKFEGRNRCIRLDYSFE